MGARTKRDAKLYRAMSEPFPDVEAANAALGAFFEELYELRRKHRIADVLAVVQFSVVEDERESARIIHLQIGDQLRAAAMAAFAFGACEAEHEALIGEIVAGAKRRAGAR